MDEQQQSPRKGPDQADQRVHGRAGGAGRNRTWLEPLAKQVTMYTKAFLGNGLKQTSVTGSTRKVHFLIKN